MSPKRYNTLTVKYSCRTAIKSMFPYFNLCLSVQLNCLLCSFTSVSFLSNRRCDMLFIVYSVLLLAYHESIVYPVVSVFCINVVY
jgi:hypothetical protein